MDFPLRHQFKVIGPREGLSVEVRATLASLGFEKVVFVERLSSGKRHVSLTFELSVESGAQLDTIYSALEQVRNVAYLL
jgi:putative lipoic acid-binding regulatory protein